MNSIAVVGIGNSLLRDDGIGVHVIEHFAAANPFEGVKCLDAGTVGLALMDHLSGLDGLVAVDAMRMKKEPGTITVLQGVDMDTHLRTHHGSVHELGLSDLMDALRLCGDLPRLRALIGIEPADMGWGAEPTEAVAAAIPLASMQIHQLIAAWREQSSRGAAA